MSDTTVLERMFHAGARIEVEDHYQGKKKVVLQEPLAPDSKIELHNIPDDAIVIDLDSAFACDSLFSGSQGECKRADYLIISEKKQRVLFVEMKKTGAKQKDIVKQLKGSLCVFEYSQAIAREFFQENNFLVGYEYRFISINHTGMKTGKTKIEKMASIHSSPELLMKVSWARVIQFNKIAA